MNDVYYIVAANRLEYEHWTNSDRPRKLMGPEYKCRYVDNVDRLRGLNDIKGFYLPNCENHPEYQAIKDQIRIIKMTSKLNSVKPVKFKWNNPVNNTGVIAQEITGVWLDEYEDSSGGKVA